VVKGKHDYAPLWKCSDKVFNTASIRVVTLEENPWFVLADVCKVLGLSNPSMAAKTLDDDQRGINIIDTPFGSQ